MSAQYQVHLKLAREPLQIPFPVDWQGERSGDYVDDEEIFVSTEPIFLTSDEIDLVKKDISKLAYPQELVYTGCLKIAPDDPLLTMTHEELSQYETENELSDSAIAPGGGRRIETRERVLIIREAEAIKEI